MASFFPRVLTRFRVPLFILMTVLTVFGGMLIPRVNINTDMSVYLPSSYPMKQGMNLVKEHSPELDEQIHSLGASFGDGDNLLPTELPKALALGVSLAVVVLLVMCSSVMEVLLFLITIGFALVLNAGSNALLPSVSMMTHSLAAVLQMVLSMDYSIILMNRYRQERTLGLQPVPSMEQAISASAPSILSSALTTIVSLLMLVFIKLKIGADLGYVLAKGVVFSLLCNFTVLPALIVWSDRAVEKTRKKIPALPAALLARFQYRFRVPLLLLFIGIFTASVILQRRTPIIFTPEWNSVATEQAQEGNPMMLVFMTEEESAVAPLLDSIAADPKVILTASWPTTLGKPCTTDEMRALLAGFSPAAESSMPPEILRMVYYLRSHPERDGRLSFAEIQATADQLAEQGLMPPGFDKDAMMQKLMPSAPARQAAKAPAPSPQPAPKETSVRNVSPEPSGDASVPADSLALPSTDGGTLPAGDGVAAGTDTLQTAAPRDTLAEAVPVPSSRFTYEQATTPINAAAMARLFGLDRTTANLFYRLSGRARGKMTPVEAIGFVREKVLPDRRYSSFISPAQVEEFELVSRQLDSTMAAGPQPAVRPEKTVEAVTEAGEAAAAADSLRLNRPETPSDTLSVPADTLSTVVLPEGGEAEEEPEEDWEEEEEDIPPTPLEVLAEMAFSQRRYPASRVQSALAAAGVPVTREEMDLLYIYALSQRDFDENQTLTPAELITFAADSLLADPALSRFVSDSLRSQLDSARNAMETQGKLLRGPVVSAAAVVTDYIQESPETFAFVDRLRALADNAFSGPHYWIGESEMYKELKEGFPGEVLILTLLTVLSIFLIVALTFRSLLIPIPLVMTVLAGVYINVFANGIGDHNLYYLSYLIVQGILMGATIDYSILFTSCYRTARVTRDIPASLEEAYRQASHSIITSGLILTAVPFIMAFSMNDAMISMILKSLCIGAFSVLLLILFVLPGVLAVLDRIARPKNAVR